MTAAPRQETDLGMERYCRRCDEWWPEDNEFWVIQRWPAGLVAYARKRPYVRRRDHMSFTCRACRRERQAQQGRERRRRPSTVSTERRTAGGSIAA